jgi:phosphate transport system substrate-binding protein
MRKWAYLLMALVSVIPLLAAACGDDDDDDDTSSPTAASGSATASPGGIASNVGKEDSANLTGAGATFPAPIYQAWFDDYNADIAKGVKVNYQPVGSPPTSE